MPFVRSAAPWLALLLGLQYFLALSAEVAGFRESHLFGYDDPIEWGELGSVLRTLTLDDYLEVIHPTLHPLGGVLWFAFVVLLFIQWRGSDVGAWGASFAGIYGFLCVTVHPLALVAAPFMVAHMCFYPHELDGEWLKEGMPTVQAFGAWGIFCFVYSGNEFYLWVRSQERARLDSESPEQA
ncbi:MAG: hypothetical protein AAF517_02680 [Planctomycetota bacterium]